MTIPITDASITVCQSCVHGAGLSSSLLPLLTILLSLLLLLLCLLFPVNAAITDAAITDTAITDTAIDTAPYYCGIWTLIIITTNTRITFTNNHVCIESKSLNIDIMFFLKSMLSILYLIPISIYKLVFLLV